MKGKEYFSQVAWTIAQALLMGTSYLEKIDPSNNTARNKIRRSYQSQEIAMGKDWKKVVENESVADADVPAEVGADEIAPQYLEVERILGCDENEMDMKILAKQHALNLRAHQEALQKREDERSKGGGGCANGRGNASYPQGATPVGRPSETH